MKRLFSIFVMIAVYAVAAAAYGAFDLEVPADPWDEFRMQYKKYSQQLLKSYDRAFANDFEGAVREAGKAIEILPDEGLAYAERGKFQLVLGNQKEAESDYKKAMAAFERAFARYQPGKQQKKTTRKIDPKELARLVTTTHYQRGEAYFGYEQYKSARDDFAIACQGGSAIACSRMWEVKAIETRGTNWVPLSSRQFYDRKRVERPAKDVVRVWIRREDSQFTQGDGALDASVQQHLELKCGSREFRIIEAFSISGSDRTLLSKAGESVFASPMPGSPAGRLLVMLCPRQ